MAPLIHKHQNLILLIAITIVVCIRISLMNSNKTEGPSHFVPAAIDTLNNVSVNVEDTISHSLYLKRRCGIPDSIPWGHYKIFLYEKGVQAELARLDSSINERRRKRRAELEEMYEKEKLGI